MIEQNLEIRRGAVFRAHGWVIRDDDGQPRTDVTGVQVVAKIRRYAGSTSVLHEFACSAVLLALPEYGDVPVGFAQIDEMTPEQTGALTFDRGVYDVLADGEAVAGGLVSLPWAVSRP